MKKIQILDYGLGNLTSIYNALRAIGLNPLFAKSKKDLEQGFPLIIPGVGSFPEGMNHLVALNLPAYLRHEAKRGRLMFGICLGMQLYAHEGEEFEIISGLNILPGKVKKLDNHQQSIKIPHTGWNTVTTSPHSRLGKNLPEKEDFYFTHSYSITEVPDHGITGTCEYGSKIVAIIELDNIFGTQFHPEKSQNAGLKILKNFCELY
jgi:imidazole glycerol-phosphate synthase subunit HisH